LAAATIYSAVDGKPKSTLSLRRLDNLRANPAASFLVDHYDENWSALWWVRVDCLGRIVDDEDERSHATHLLAAKYPQYRMEPPPGEVIALEVERWSYWSP
jgi:PPOX class probable F420-dependent enzyme